MCAHMYLFVKRFLQLITEDQAKEKILHMMGCVAKFNQFATAAGNMIVLKQNCDPKRRFVRSPNKQPDTAFCFQTSPGAKGPSEKYFCFPLCLLILWFIFFPIIFLQ